MGRVQQVEVGSFDTARFESVLSTEKYEELIDATVRALDLFDGRVVWNINSTARGGGVAEMLQSLLAYARGAGVDARWAVIEGDPDFFRVTKRIHNHLHGSPGDGGELGDEEHRIYDATIEANAAELLDLIGPKDVVIVHDPQPAGLTQLIKDRAAAVVWRCHVGLDTPNDVARNAWKFLLGYVQPADRYVFSRRAYAWEGLETDRITIIPPSIDSFAPKNQDMDESAIAAIVGTAGLVDDPDGGKPVFVRWDQSKAHVVNRADMYDGGPPAPKDARLVVQVSRWDRLKDPVGVIEGFADHVAPAVEDAHLILGGPAVAAVSDDPEGQEVLEECKAAWEKVSPEIQGRIHLACLPMDDAEENAAIVNALQRRADIVVQKSLAEGFGLTVAEAMWKARPVVASRIGGIQDQVIDDETGVLIDDPHNLKEYGGAVVGLLEDADRAEKLGHAAQERVRDEFLGARSLIQYVDLFQSILTP